MFLQRCGYDVTAVHDGVSCVEALNTNEPYDVLILSWELPWGEGEAILDWVRYQGIDNLAVVVLTARMGGSDFLEGSMLPRVAWVQRPFRLIELLDAVESTERIPRRSWRTLESLIRKSATPVNSVVFDGNDSTGVPVEARILRPYRTVQEKQRRMPVLERDMQPVVQE